MYENDLSWLFKDVNEKFKEQQAERDDLISEIERKQK